MEKPWYTSKVVLVNSAMLLTVIATALNALVGVIPAPYDQVATPLIAAVIAGINIYLRSVDPEKPLTK